MAKNCVRVFRLTKEQHKQIEQGIEIVKNMPTDQLRLKIAQWINVFLTLHEAGRMSVEEFQAVCGQALGKEGLIVELIDTMDRYELEVAFMKFADTVYFMDQEGKLSEEDVELMKAAGQLRN